MIYISEEESAALVTHELAFTAARQALAAAASQRSRVFPAVLGRALEAINTFSIKSGTSGASMTRGLRRLPARLTICRSSSQSSRASSSGTSIGLGHIQPTIRRETFK